MRSKDQSPAISIGFAIIGLSFGIAVGLNCRLNFGEERRWYPKMLRWRPGPQTLSLIDFGTSWSIIFQLSEGICGAAKSLLPLIIVLSVAFQVIVAGGYYRNSSYSLSLRDGGFARSSIESTKQVARTADKYQMLSTVVVHVEGMM